MEGEYYTTWTSPLKIFGKKLKNNSLYPFFKVNRNLVKRQVSKRKKEKHRKKTRSLTLRVFSIDNKEKIWYTQRIKVLNQDMTKESKKEKLDQNTINIYGVKVHNLKDIDIKIPKNKLVVFCGVSGSGKTSLAFDTIYAEAERRYVESLSSYARQFLGIKEKPNLEKIENLSPAISIDQRSLMKNPRSTVATITEIHDYLRVLFARVGTPTCPKCGIKITHQSPSQISKQVISLPQGSHFYILAPLLQGKKGEHKGVLEEVYRLGYPRVRFDKNI